MMAVREKCPVSVVVPLYNASVYFESLTKNIDEIFKAIPDAQVVMVANGCIDDTFEKAEAVRNALAGFNVKTANTYVKGTSHARNLGMELADGEFVIFFDCDDELYAENLARIVDEARKEKYHDVNLFFGLMNEYRLTPGGARRLVNGRDYNKYLNAYPGIADGVVTDRKAVYDLINYKSDLQTLGLARCVFRTSFLRDTKLRFDENVWMIEDMHFLINAVISQKKFYISSLPLYNYLQPANFWSKYKITEKLKNTSKKDYDSLYAWMMQGKSAIVYVTDFNDFELLKLSARSCRHFNPDIKQFVLTYEPPTQQNIQRCESIGAECVCVKELFDKTFPFFKESGKDYVRHSNGAKYPKIVLARLLMPYVEKLREYQRILYLDNDCVACRRLDEMLFRRYSRCVTICFDGQSRAQAGNRRNYWSMVKYDYWNIAKSFYCPVPLIFSLDADLLPEHDEFIARINEAQPRILADRGDFLTDQEILNLYCRYDMTRGNAVYAKYGPPPSEETCIYHYWPVKRCKNFRKIIADTLYRAHKDISWLNEYPGNSVLNISIVKDQGNYGQRLQTFALQKFIFDKLGVFAFTLDDRAEDQLTDRVKQSESDMLFYRSKYENVDADMFDTVIVGSDQVWTSTEPKYYVEKYKDRMKLVSYAASANGNLEHDAADRADMLAAFKAVSFREKADADAYAGFKNGRQTVNWHIDPVFFLTEDQWKSLAEKPFFISDGEIFDFTYLLTPNGSPFSKIEADGVKNYTVCQNRKLPLSYREFIWMAANCRKIHTASFHGVAFGIIFGREIEYLDGDLSALAAGETVKNSGWFSPLRVQNVIQALKADFRNGKIQNRKEVSDRINQERERALRWLSDCLSYRDFKYACYAKDAVMRGRSSSGGMAAVLAAYVIGRGGVVYGAAYSGDFKSVKTVRVSSMEEYFAKISKSKYSFCEMPDIDEVKADVESGKPVLFIGCPCQIKKLKSALRGDRENLLTADLLCSGWSRSELLREFIEQQEAEENSKVAAMDMRPRHGADLYLKFQNGKEKTLQNVVYKIFVCNKANYMDDCKVCGMHAAGNSAADLTIGDFWDYGKHKDACGPQFSPAMGTSVVYVNTEKGRCVFNGVKPALEWRYLR